MAANANDNVAANADEEVTDSTVEYFECEFDAIVEAMMTSVEAE